LQIPKSQGVPQRPALFTGDSLGIKQLGADPAAEVPDKVRKGDVVTCTVTKVGANGIEGRVRDVLTGFLRRA
jgi:small subunit ribosomal protein S1